MPFRPSPGSYPGPVQVPSRVRGGPVQIRHVLCFTVFRTLQPLLFWKKLGFFPKKSKGFSLRGTPQILGKGRKNARKSKENRKPKKTRKSKKARIGGSGQYFGPIQVPRWGSSRPVLVPSCSRAFLTGSGLDGQKQTSWPLPIGVWNFWPRPILLTLQLTFFHADFGKEFPSRNLWRGPSRNCPFPSSVLCPLLYRTEHFSRGEKGEKGAEKRGGKGVTSKGGKKEKRTRENRTVKDTILKGISKPQKLPWIKMKSYDCPCQSAEMCRRILLYKFWRIFPGIFLADFSGHSFPQKRGEKSGDKIREKIRRLKNKNPRKIRSAKSRP